MLDDGDQRPAKNGERFGEQGRRYDARTPGRKISGREVLTA